MNHSDGAQSPPLFGMYPLPYWATNSQFLLMMNFQNPLMSPIHNLGSPILTSNLNFPQPPINFDIKCDQSQIIKETPQPKQPQQYFSQIQTIQQQIEEMNYEDITLDNLEQMIHLIFADSSKVKNYVEVERKMCESHQDFRDFEQENQVIIKEQRRINQILSQKSIPRNLPLNPRKIQNQLLPSSFSNLTRQKNQNRYPYLLEKQQNQNHEQPFLHELFQSKQFQDQYKTFQIILIRSLRMIGIKIKALAEKSWEFISSNRKAYSVKRLPWSIKNIEKLKETANELLNYCKEQQKQ